MHMVAQSIYVEIKQYSDNWLGTLECIIFKKSKCWQVVYNNHY